jgi:SAM-dependent methyltransferase
MKPFALFFIPIILAVSAGIGSSQSFRGAGAGDRGPEGWRQARPQGEITRSRLQERTEVPPAPRARPAPSFRDHATPWQRARPQSDVTRNRIQGTTGVPSALRARPAPSFRHPAPPRQSVFVRVPRRHVAFVPVHYYFPYRYYSGHPASLIVVAPGFAAATAYSPYAPGVVYREPRAAYDSAVQTPGRYPGQVAPFDPTPMEIVERMLALAAVKPDDLLYDLGSGDGRVVIAAAKKFGARAVGFEIDPGLVKLARENAQREGVDHLVEFREQDFLTADLSDASVVTIYLSYDGNIAVRPQLLRQLKPGARVVSYTFDMGDWQAKIAESYRDKGGNTHMLYFWEIGEPQTFSDRR